MAFVFGRRSAKNADTVPLVVALSWLLSNGYSLMVSRYWLLWNGYSPTVLSNGELLSNGHSSSDGYSLSNGYSLMVTL